eukprot:evm.model.scf_332.1 EVM.evm.TU.scf_332.1   scf_332:13322-17780(+)
MAGLAISILALVALACSAGRQALGYPTFWEKCDKHPTKALGEHLAPAEDRTTHFQLLKVDEEGGKSLPVSEFCPGVVYHLRVAYGPADAEETAEEEQGEEDDGEEEDDIDGRRSVVTTSSGVFEQDGDDEGHECGGIRKTNNKKLLKHRMTWTADCPETADGEPGEVTFMVTSATGEHSKYYQSEFTYKRGDECPPCEV